MIHFQNFEQVFSWRCLYHCHVTSDLLMLRQHDFHWAHHHTCWWRKHDHVLASTSEATSGPHLLVNNTAATLFVSLRTSQHSAAPPFFLCISPFLGSFHSTLSTRESFFLLFSLLFHVCFSVCILYPWCPWISPLSPVHDGGVSMFLLVANFFLPLPVSCLRLIGVCTQFHFALCALCM